MTLRPNAIDTPIRSAPAMSPLPLGDDRFRRLEFAQHDLAALEIERADFGRSGAARIAIEQAHAKPPLKVGHMLGYGRLGEPEIVRRAREAARLDNANEKLKPSQAIHHARRCSSIPYSAGCSALWTLSRIYRLAATARRSPPLLHTIKWCRALNIASESGDTGTLRDSRRLAASQHSAYFGLPHQGPIRTIQLMPTLFDPIAIGDLHLPNRILMAPLTRNRSTGPGRVPNVLMRDYYVQRAGAGLITSEATSVTPMGVGYPHTPGVWSQEQIDGWGRITESVHAAGGRILLQLWHVGRISDPSYHEGALPVAPSAIAPKGHVSLLRPERPYVVPRALETEEVAGVVEAFRQGARNAKSAGFDGVEIHGANGYLLDQFLQDGGNKRTDQYGGPIENRARLMLEVTDAVVSVVGSEAALACIWRRAPTPMTWATATFQARSAMWRANSANERSLSSAPGSP